MDYYEPNNITCSTIQSLQKLESQLPKMKNLIVDEVHEFSSSKSSNSLKLLQDTVWRLGFSATPFKKVQQ